MIVSVFNMQLDGIQLGYGFEDFGPALKLKPIYQRGGRKKYQPLYSPLPVYYPRNRYQHGAGIGSLFMPLFRFLTPIVQPLLSKGLDAVKREFISSGVDVLSSDKPVNEAVKMRAKAAVKNLSEKAKAKVKTMIGAGRRKKYKRRVKPKKQKQLVKSCGGIKKRCNKKKNKDIFS